MEGLIQKETLKKAYCNYVQITPYLLMFPRNDQLASKTLH